VAAGQRQCEGVSDGVPTRILGPVAICWRDGRLFAGIAGKRARCRVGGPGGRCLVGGDGRGKGKTYVEGVWYQVETAVALHDFSAY
jgi:hypothetical protein